MDGMMTSGTERDEIMGMVVGLIFVNMMDVEIIAPAVTLFTAKLTRPVITIFDCFCDGLPVM